MLRPRRAVRLLASTIVARTPVCTCTPRDVRWPLCCKIVHVPLSIPTFFYRVNFPVWTLNVNTGTPNNFPARVFYVGHAKKKKKKSDKKHDARQTANPWPHKKEQSGRKKTYTHMKPLLFYQERKKKRKKRKTRTHQTRNTKKRGRSTRTLPLIRHSGRRSLHAIRA